MRDAVETALSNIVKFGDTDVFPFPVENHVFFDNRDRVLQYLLDLDSSFDQHLRQDPVTQERSAAAVGYYGFRWATLIDPFWNAYLLALIVRVGHDIESKRIPVEKQVIFSYRFAPDRDAGTIFNPAIGWTEFQTRTRELAHLHQYVLECDISDFYPRVYHHRIKNALSRATTDTEAVRRITVILKQLSKGMSFGLPVGGPAARLLSELLLNGVDRLLLNEGISFCRFADDYRIFGDSREAAYRSLIYLTEKLFENEGLSLQKSKTLIMSNEEFLSTRPALAPDVEPESDEQGFLMLRLHYDPYSITADDDYEELQAELERYDIHGMLMRQMGKSRIDQHLTRRLIRAVRFLKPHLRDRAALSLIENLEVLYPVIPTTMLLFRSVWDELSTDTTDLIARTLRQRIRDGSYVLQVPINQAFAVRVLAYDRAEETDEVLTRIYRSTSSPSIRRDVILAMARREAAFWLSDRLKYWRSLHVWEIRALLVASYTLGDEGAYWRDGVKGELHESDLIVSDWAAQRKNANKWEVPL